VTLTPNKSGMQQLQQLACTVPGTPARSFPSRPCLWPLGRAAHPVCARVLGGLRALLGFLREGGQARAAPAVGAVRACPQSLSHWRAPARGAAALWGAPSSHFAGARSRGGAEGLLVGLGEVGVALARDPGNNPHGMVRVAGLHWDCFGSSSDSSADATVLLFSLILHQLPTLLWK